MKMYYKKIIAVVLLLAILCFVPVISSAKVDTTKFKPNDMSDNDYKTAIDKAAPVIKALLNIGIIVGTVGIAFLGLRYMIGSASEKAEYKETLLPFFIGAIFMFGVSSILRIIAGIFA